MAYYSFIFSQEVRAQQISLYDSKGDACAYIDLDDEMNIYLWDGTPVAFLEKDGNEICIFGFNGRFLAWYENGIVYDNKGYVIAAKKGVVNMIYRIEPIKGLQRITPLKSITQLVPMQPMLRDSWSDNLLKQYLYKGRE